jgi:hypothetical protein
MNAQGSDVKNVRILETPPTCDKVERFGVSIDEDTK